MRNAAALALIRAAAGRMYRHPGPRWFAWFSRVRSAAASALGTLDSTVSGMQARRWGRTFTTIVLLVPVYLVGAAASPGLYTPDSEAQLSEALSGVYGDWNPPIMSALWAKLIAATGTPESLLWLNLTLLAAGLWLWSVAARRAGKAWAVLFVVAAAFGPQLLNFAGVLWKDVGFAMAMFAAFALVTESRRGGRRAVPVTVVIVVLAFYAVGVRVNGFPAVLPLLFVAILGFIPGRGWRRHFLAGGAALAGTFVLIAMNWGLSYRVLDATRTHPEQYIQLYDLTGISVRTGEDRVPAAYKEPHFTVGRLVGAYKPNSGNYLFWAEPGQQTILKLRLDDPTARAKLRESWIAAILDSPAAYVNHRTDVFLSLMRIGYEQGYFWHVSFSAKPAASSWPGGDAAARFLRRAFFATEKHTVLFFGWVWLLVLAVATVAGWLYRKEPLAGIAAAQAISGLAYMLPYYFIAPASDFRYLYWSVIAGTVSGAVLAGIAVQDLFRRYARSHSPPGTTGNIAAQDFSRSS